MELYQEIIASSRYARYLPDFKRRETWEETVTRLTSFIAKMQPKLQKEIQELHQAI